MQMEQTLVESSDPQATVMVPQQLGNLELQWRPREPIRLDPAVHELLDSIASADQQSTFIGLSKSSDEILLPWNRKEFRRSWLPAPEPIL